MKGEASRCANWPYLFAARRVQVIMQVIMPCFGLCYMKKVRPSVNGVLAFKKCAAKPSHQASYFRLWK